MSEVESWRLIQPITNLEDTTTWPEGYVSCRELPTILNKYLNDQQDLVGAEVGVCRGEGAAYIMQYCPTVKKLYAIDQWSEYDDGCGAGPNVGYFSQECMQYWKSLFNENTKTFTDRIQIIEKDSVSAASDIQDNELDFVFIDADHSIAGALRDMIAYWPKVKSGGLFTGHDFWHLPLRYGLLGFLIEKGIDVEKDLFIFQDTCWGIVKP